MSVGIELPSPPNDIALGMTPNPSNRVKDVFWTTLTGGSYFGPTRGICTQYNSYNSKIWVVELVVQNTPYPITTNATTDNFRNDLYEDRINSFCTHRIKTTVARCYDRIDLRWCHVLIPYWKIFGLWIIKKFRIKTQINPPSDDGGFLVCYKNIIIVFWP